MILAFPIVVLCIAFPPLVVAGAICYTVGWCYLDDKKLAKEQKKRRER
ncbi:hypothetical protein VPHD292_0029 [Vibrio phage D292]